MTEFDQNRYYQILNLWEKMNAIHQDLNGVVNTINNLEEELNHSFTIEEKRIEKDSISNTKSNIQNQNESVLNVMNELRNMI